MKNIIFAASFLFLTLNNAWAVTISAQVDRNPVHLDETFNIFFEADSSPDDDPDFSPLDKDFEILNQSQSSNISIINGNYTKKIKWTLAVMAKRAGTLSIPPIHFGKDSSSSIRLSVKASEQGKATTDADVFIELDIQPEKAWAQGQVLITLRFYSAINLSSFSGFSDLKTEGVDAIIEKLGEDKQYQTKRGQRQYLVVERRLALFPQNSGSLKILPLLAEARLAGRASSIFDPFQRAGQIKRVRSTVKEIQVQAKPSSYKSTPWLPANEIQIAEEWPDKSAEFKAGEPITRTLTIMADGLTSAQLPEFVSTQIKDIKQYPDKPVLQDNREDSGIIGIRQEKIAYIPTRKGNYTLPPIEIKWWNVQTGKQESSRIPARTIEVNAGEIKASKTSPTVTIEPEKSVGQSPAPSLEKDAPSSVWIGLSLFFALGWLLTIGLWWLSKRRASKPQITSPAPTLQQAMKKLIESCKTSTPDSCKESLLNWGQQRYPNHRINSLGQLGRQAGEPLLTEINRLETTLYGANKENWEPGEIIRICQQLTHDASAKKDPTKETLEPLYK